MGWHTLPWSYEMEPFVRICHGHFPLKQYTLEAEPHLVAINLHGLMTGKWTMSLFYIRGAMNSRPCLKEREEETREQEQMWCCASPQMPASVPSKEKKRDPLYSNNH